MKNKTLFIFSLLIMTGLIISSCTKDPVIEEPEPTPPTNPPTNPPQQETGEFTDARDNQTYNYVKIGEQYWMSENLNFETDSSACLHMDSIKCESYGRLYAFSVAQAACPDGWKLPSKADWEELLESVGGMLTSGPIIMEEGSSNFKGKYAGYRDDGGLFQGENFVALWWTTEYDEVNDWATAVLQREDREDTWINSTFNPHTMASCRCLKE